MSILSQPNTHIIDQLEYAYSEGIIPLSSLEFAHFIHGLFPDIDEQVLLAGFLAFHVTLNGDTHLDIRNASEQIRRDEGLVFIELPETEQWLSSLENSQAIVQPGEQGILLLEEGAYLYLHKHWKFEQKIAQWIKERTNSYTDLSSSEESIVNELAISGNQEQRDALIRSFSSSFSMISGGPGTGKTHTVFNILLAHIRNTLQLESHPLRIAVCAPTGKAAARLMEALTVNESYSKLSEQELEVFPAKSHTIHKLLGVKSDGASTYNEANKLPYDLIVLDEASMIDVGLMYRFIEAVSTTCRVLLLGDKDQLASVEAGAVFGDLCKKDEQVVKGEDVNSAFDYITFLHHSYRFKEDSSIKQVADCIINERMEELGKLISEQSDIYQEWGGEVNAAYLFEQYIKPHVEIYKSKATLSETLDAFLEFKLLAPLRKGNAGVDTLNAYFEGRLKKKYSIDVSQEWYQGRPILITKNDASLRVQNGDTGICYIQNGEPYVYFSSTKEEGLSIQAERLEHYELAFVSTVHKSQGSEHKKVLLLLPNKENPIISKQLLYTAVTRARESILIVGRREVLLNSLQNNVERITGLSRKL